MQQEKINELIKQVEALVYYSQIHTVKGVRAAHMPDHETAWRKAQQWLWDKCKADEMGNYALKEQHPGTAIWVKASEFKFEVGISYCAKDERSRGAGFFHKNGAFIWGDGSITHPRDQDDLLILVESESPSKEGAGWVKADTKPEHNVGVLVFIPGEDNHITSGMWDISNEWVLLDEYRTPEEEVTHWMPLPAFPEGYMHNEIPAEWVGALKEAAKELGITSVVPPSKEGNKDRKEDNKLIEFIRDCAENWDCDPDSHTYNLPCRKCEATKLYEQFKNRNNVNAVD
jgi:hypothetical protein